MKFIKFGEFNEFWCRGPNLRQGDLVQRMLETRWESFSFPEHSYFGNIVRQGVVRDWGRVVHAGVLTCIELLAYSASC